MTRARTLPALAALVAPTLLAGCGTDVNGPGGSVLSCIYGDPTPMATGQVLQLESPDESLCVRADDDAAGEFVFIPFLATPAPDEDDAEVTVTVDITATGLPGLGQAPVAPDPGMTGTPAGRAPAPVYLSDPVGTGPGAGPGAGDALTGGARWIDPVFHHRLRQREIRELEPRIRTGPGTAPGVGALRTGPVADVPAVGEVLELNVAISCSATDIRQGEVMYVSDHAVVVADQSNPAQLGPEDYAYFGVTFDTLVYPVETAHFGAPTDIDANGRSILFFTTAVNALNPPDAESVTIGFFWSGDLFPETETPRLEACPAANQAEMFYLIAPDPDGVVGAAFTLDDVRKLAIPLIGHEFQHLVNASRRMFVNDATTFEEPWLNEGLSHIAEELLFYEAAGLDRGMNLDADALRATPNGVAAFNEYMGGNLTNLRRYLSHPDTASLMGIDLLATRGASWAFLRYAADRSGQGDEAFFFAAVNGQRGGLDHLAGVLGEDPLAWMRDWTVSVYADDFVDGLAPRYRMASWDLRALYEGTNVGAYPLAVRRATTGSDGPVQVTLLPGGAAFIAFDMGAGETGLVHVESGPLPPADAVTGSLVRAR